MRETRRATIFPALAALLLLALVAVSQPGMSALAQLNAGYDLSWWTVDSGGATFHADGGALRGNGYSLSGTIGQPDAALAPDGRGHTLLIGDGYALMGGFWPGAAAVLGGRFVYLPVVLRGA